MPESIVLDAKQVPAHLRGIGNYTGRRFVAIVCESVSIPADAGLWSGGTRELFTAVRIADGAELSLPGQDASPFDRPRESSVAALRPGMAIVCHSVFCGKDMGLTFYVLPCDSAPMLPAPAPELSHAESIVLAVTAAYIARARREYAERAGVDAAAFASTQETLRAKGLMTKQGGLTTAGHNAANALPAQFKRL